MKLRIAGAELYLSVGLLPLFAVAIVIGETKALLFTAAALLLHEGAHWIAAHNLGYAVSKFSVYPFGCVMDLSSLKADKKHEWIVASAGPLASFMIASSLNLIATAWNAGNDWINSFYRTNLVISLLNCLPAYPLDGGRAIRQMFLRVCSEKHANLITLVLSSAVASGMITCGVFLFVHGVPAWTLFVIPPFIAAASIRELKNTGSGAVGHLIERNTTLHAGIPQKARIIVIDGNARIGDAMAKISYSDYTIFRIKKGFASFEIDETDLLKAASLLGYQTKLNQISI